MEASDMAKRPETIETLRMVIELLRHIPRDRKVSASMLHKHLADAGIDRDLRTIQRQMEMLSDYYPIERDERSRPYGYKWKEKTTGFSLQMLSEQESLILTLAEKQLSNLLPASVMKSMQDFFDQARSNLDSDALGKRSHEWLSKVRVVSTTQPLIPPKIKKGVFEEVSNALYGNRWLRLDYKNAESKTTNIEVMPLGLAQQGPRMYLVCRYQGYDNERSLAMHRISKAETLSHSFIRPKDFDLEQYDNDGRFGFGEGKRVNLRFRISKGAGFHLLESPLSTDQVVKEFDDQYQIQATVVESAQLHWWLRGFGDQISNVKLSKEK
jgi:predicted DNA-binding transcriptional regulator YafY